MNQNTDTVSVSRELLSQVAEEINMMPGLKWMHAQLIAVMEQPQPDPAKPSPELIHEIACALWLNSSLRHGLFTPPRFRAMCEETLTLHFAPNP